MANPVSKIPVLLFPLKLETRFVADELWIRVFPDTVFMHSHNPELTGEEKNDATAFKGLTSREEKKQAWEELVAKYGVYRSSWLARIRSEELERQPDNGLKETEPEFFFKWLPDRFVFYLYKAGDQKPSYKRDGSVIDREGLAIMGDGDDWLQDFNKAVQAGMGIKMRIDPADTKFEKVIVSGFRYDKDPRVPAGGLADLFDNHMFTEGFSFLDYGTPTNNTENAKSGYSARDEFEVGDSFEYAVEGLDLDGEAAGTGISEIHRAFNGKSLSRILGFETDHLKHVKNADKKSPLLNELYQKASWFALGAQPLFMLLGNRLDSEAHESIWQHYSGYVRHRGPYTALKAGDQPYGILPVMNISNVFLPENKDILDSGRLPDKMKVFLARLMRRWVLMAKGKDARVPALKGDHTHEEVLRILSMHESSSSYQIRAMEYQFFKSRLYDLAKDNSGRISSLDNLRGNGDDFERVRENVRSLSALFDLDDKHISAQIDQLLRAPLLSFVAGDSNLIGFEDGRSFLKDQSENKITNGDKDSESFSLTEENPENLQDFIDALRGQKDGELVYYRASPALFTDLFIRSYINASQLYFREIVFEPEVTDSGISRIGKIEKPEGSGIRKGETVITIKTESKDLDMKAPFDGTVRKVLVKEMQEVSPGTPLFVLLNETKFREIKSAFIEMGQELVNSIKAIPEGEERQKAQMSAIGEAIDLNSYRLDAWITSLAARRIDEMRDDPDHEKGIYFGAYGWIEDLEKDKTKVDAGSLTDIYNDAGGIIHTPGAAQMVASSVFKNSFLAHDNEELSNPFTVNLTSDRLQKGKFLLEGIRQGQELEALLGYQLERHLHENNLHRKIYELREAFPLYENVTGDSTGFVNLSVIDGLKAIKHKESLPQQVKMQVEKLEDTLDACLDTLFFETGFQVTQGNLSNAAAALDATKGEIEPPAIESLKTRIPGSGIDHKLVMVFQGTRERYSLENTRAFAEPNLERWLEENLGPLEKIVCSVEIYDDHIDGNLIESAEVTLADLDIGYLGFFYLSEEPVSDGAGELELRIRNAVLQQVGNLPEEIRFVIKNGNREDSQPLNRAIEVARYARELFTSCRYLRSDDLTMEKETIQYDRKGLDEIRDRLLPIVEHLKETAESDLNGEGTLKLLATMDFPSAKTAFLEGVPADTERLKAAIEAKTATAGELLSRYDSEDSFDKAFGYLQQAAKSFFSESFILLPPVTASVNFKEVLKSKNQQLLVGDPADNDTQQVWGEERIKTWIQGLSQVHENSEKFEDWLMVSTAWDQMTGLSPGYKYTVVQSPTLLKYPWAALSKQEIDLVLERQFDGRPVYSNPGNDEAYPLSDGTYYPDGCESTVIYRPDDLTLEEPVWGLVIEEFSEHVPGKKVNTGLSFNYNIPNNEPPQAILLAIHPRATDENVFFWSEDDLRDIICDTMDLYKIRMVDLEAIQEYGFILPMTWWLNIPGNK